MPTNKFHRASASDSVTASGDVPAVVVKPVPAAKKIKPRYVLVENKMRQVLTLSVVNDDGRAEELKLQPLATSPAVREDRLTDQIRRLADSGQVRIR